MSISVICADGSFCCHQVTSHNRRQQFRCLRGLFGLSIRSFNAGFPGRRSIDSAPESTHERITSFAGLHRYVRRNVDSHTALQLVSSTLFQPDSTTTSFLTSLLSFFWPFRIHCGSRFNSVSCPFASFFLDHFHYRLVSLPSGDVEDSIQCSTPIIQMREASLVIYVSVMVC